jgi:hypothetical protein
MRKLTGIVVTLAAIALGTQGAFAAATSISQKSAASACSKAGGEWECFDSTCSSATCDTGSANITCSKGVKTCTKVTYKLIQPGGVTGIKNPTSAGAATTSPAVRSKILPTTITTAPSALTSQGILGGGGAGSAATPGGKAKLPMSGTGTQTGTPPR